MNHTKYMHTEVLALCTDAGLRMNV